MAYRTHPTNPTVALESRLVEIRRLEAINAKLFAALESIKRRATHLDDGVPTDSPADTQVGVLWSLADEAIKDATK